ncbi:MAG TPA: hypothetical protein VLC93_10925, partial [Myxococcota bacterium]|nr:hypothetical protein [Myxococcota bacterium]
TLCRNADNVCDVADYCNGSSFACPDNVQPPSVACRGAAQECDAVEYCNGASHACPGDASAPDFTPCAGGIYYCCSGSCACGGGGDGDGDGG